MTRAIIARAPTRLDFAGGWTDVPPYCDREGGLVCNIAITRYATATAASGGHVAGPRSSPASATAADDALVRAAVARSTLSSADAQLASDFPLGAGLGGSSAAGVALAGALRELAGSPLDPASLAALSRATEVDELGLPGGSQDHYAAAIGGALLLTFSDCVGVERIDLSARCRAAIARRGVVLYTGESRISGDTILAVLDGYLAGDPRVVGALARTKALAVQVAAALRTEDLDALGVLIGENWVEQRRLHPSITTPRIDAIVDTAARHGALGTKALGASGGGCVLAFAADGREDELADALASLGTRLEYEIDTAGFDVIARLTGDARHHEEQR